MVETQQDRNQW